MKSTKWQPLVSVILLAASISWGLWLIKPPSPVPAAAPGIEFSAQRALAHVREIAQRPHPVNSAESVRVRRYIADTFRNQGLQVTLQRTEHPDGSVLENILAVHPGSAMEHRTILLVAHSDSVHLGPGAADDAAGVATLLETARIIDTLPTRHDVAFLVTDGEEAGLLGAQEFVSDNPDLMPRIDVVLNFEARGVAGPVIMFETGSGNPALVHALSKVCPNPVATSFAQDVYKSLPNDTDFTIFRRAGKTGMNFAVVKGVAYYHSPQDDIAHLSPASVQHYGSYAAPLARYLANADDAFLQHLADTRQAVYFPVLPGSLAVYPGSWTISLSLFAAVMLIVVLATGLARGQLRALRILVGVAGALVAAAFAGALGWLAVAAIRGLFGVPSHGIFMMGLPWAGTIMLALLVLTFALTLLWRQAMLRLTRPGELLAGALLIWATAAGAAAIALPGANYLFLWPTLAGTLALAASASRRSLRPWNILLRQALTIMPPAILFAPVMVLMYDTLTLGLAPGLMSLTVLILALACGNPPQPKPAQLNPQES